MIQINEKSAISYPKEIISECRENVNNITRKRRASRLLGADSVNPTLLEVERPQLYQFYDVFEIEEFTFSENSAAGHLKIQISLLNTFKDLKISAQILDLGSEKVIAEISPKTASDTNYLIVEEDFTVGADIEIKQLGVIAYGDWGNITPEDNQLSAFKKANSTDYDYIYRHVYPKKEKEAVILGELESRYAERGVTGDKDHIVIALIRRPDDVSDVDYICGFGRDEKTGNTPNLCVPGQGDLVFDKTEIPKEDEGHKNSAVCRLYRKGGGAAVVAATPDYECDQIIEIMPMEHGYHYEFVSWGKGYHDPAGWKKTEFDYKLEMKVYTVVKKEEQEDEQEDWRIHELIVTSLKGLASFTEEVPSLQIMYGCMAPDTLIRMADGTEQEIRCITIGDRVMGRDNRQMRVVNVWRGPEMENMVEIHAEGMPSKGLFLTKAHPVWVKDENGTEGWKQAGQCTTKDMVLVKEGYRGGEEIYRRILEIREKEPSSDVYNLDLEPYDGRQSGADSVNMFCGGILTGDNKVQNNLWR